MNIYPIPTHSYCKVYMEEEELMIFFFKTSGNFIFFSTDSLAASLSNDVVII